MRDDPLRIALVVAGVTGLLAAAGLAIARHGWRRGRRRRRRRPELELLHGTVQDVKDEPASAGEEHMSVVTERGDAHRWCRGVSRSAAALHVMAR